MKSFKKHMTERDSHYKDYPGSYLRNKRLMALVDKHNDPLRFLLDVLHQMNIGKLKLRIVGAASTREVAALWNHHKKKQIPEDMLESIQLDEARKLSQVMWKDDMDFDNPEIQVFGLGVYTLKTLRSNIAMKLEDLAKRVKTDSSWVWKQITDPKQILHNLVGALYDAEEELSSSASKRKITMMKRKR